MTIRGDNATRRRLRYRPDSDLMIELSWYGLTDAGLRRENNQDSFVVAPPLFAVADGMGGHAAGEVASAAVVRRLAELEGDDLVTAGDIAARLIDAVDDIELEVGDTGTGAGTTVTGAVFGTDPESPSWTVFNIGDSRVYQYFKGALSQITVDHSVVQHLLDTGAISAEEAEVHPHANVITRAVGFHEEPVPDTVSLALIPGQRILICSDGLTRELTDLGIQHFLSQCDTAEEAAKTLIEQALGNAGRDNVTVIVIDVHAVGETRDTYDVSVLAAAEARAAAESAAAESTAVESTEREAEDGAEGAEGAAAVDGAGAAPVAHATEPTRDFDTDEVYIGDERVEHLLAGHEIAARQHVGEQQVSVMPDSTAADEASEPHEAGEPHDAGEADEAGEADVANEANPAGEEDAGTSS